MERKAPPPGDRFPISRQRPWSYLANDEMAKTSASRTLGRIRPLTVDLFSAQRTEAIGIVRHASEEEF
jgi:hypothetical protein